ncbi:MAG: alpha/beta hydrolase, partial [Actinobacteria bacterium]|nr:alpha/beta hydrolase [Actinomycetota bacterium]
MLMHGGGQTRHAWGGAGAAFAHAGYRAVSVDLRGHSDSDWSPDG